ncbi:MAG: PD-(D/E)XK nuclease family protein [Sandaracinaceae bacterium]
MAIARAAAERQALAARAIRERAPAAPLVLVAPSLEAGSRALRLAVEGRTGAFGHQRTTLAELSTRLAAPSLAGRGLVPVAHVALEAICARAVHTRRADGGLGRFAPLGERPGLPRALARTFRELGAAGLTPSAEGLDPDLAAIWRTARTELASHGLATRDQVLEAAIERATDPAPYELLDHPLVLLDLAVHGPLEERLLAAMAARAPTLAIAPRADAASIARLCRALGVDADPIEEPPAATALGRLRAELFAAEPAPGAIDESVEVLSAPGESRECVEIARRVLRAAQRGVPFDRVAILAHDAERYRAHLVEALGRARIPAYFSRGTVRPDPSGRALLALLACKEERLSARAFAEYLSLGVVPDEGHDPDDDAFVLPDPELAPSAWAIDEPIVDAQDDAEPVDEAQAIVRGTLRAPWRWERLIVDAAVVGTSTARWRRRLEGLDHELHDRILGLEDDADPMRARIERQRRDLADLSAFALPLLEVLDGLPDETSWAGWAEALEGLARRAIRDPSRVLAVLRELAPMGSVGPIALAEARLVLARRLTEMFSAPRGAPAGKLFVGSTGEARGLSFSLVFVPGLAERGFPKKISEDPILRDDARSRISEDLPTSAMRIADERLALHLAIGAAEDAIVLSYPRLDAERGRPRVPSFYALEVLRAIEGALPSFEELASRAQAAGEAKLAWPAPTHAEDAIDGAEYDLAVLRDLLEAPSMAGIEGGARYLLEANEHLQRSLRQRWMRWETPKWTTQDGLLSPSPEVVSQLEAYRPSARAYSATSLEHLASCPYRFYLRSIVGLPAAREAPGIEALDPLARGRLMHEIQFAVLAELRARAALPLTEARLSDARAILDDVAVRVGARKAEELAPAIERVFEDALADIKVDLGQWLERMAEDPSWTPVAFELAFGLPRDADHDPSSTEDPVSLPQGLSLIGSIDLVERRGPELRATDFKSGADRGEIGVTSGGRVLQPTLYAMALEQLHPGTPVSGGRLYYCTSRGGYATREVRLGPPARAAIEALVGTLDHFAREAFFVAAPDDGACEGCDYLAVCGLREERRSRRKDRKRLHVLAALRKQP